MTRNLSSHELALPGAHEVHLFNQITQTEPKNWSSWTQIIIMLLTNASQLAKRLPSLQVSLQPMSARA